MAYLSTCSRPWTQLRAELARRGLFLGVGLLLLPALSVAQRPSGEHKAPRSLPVAAAPVTAAPAPVTAAPAPVVAAPQEISPDSIFVNPEVRPQFVGGERGLAAYLRESVRYPEKALRSRISGRVYVNFVLSATGKVQDVHVVRGPGYGLNEEALRVVWLMPPWEPAQVKGRPVRVVCTIPISFTLAN